MSQIMILHVIKASRILILYASKVKKILKIVFSPVGKPDVREQNILCVTYLSTCTLPIKITIDLFFVKSYKYT